MHGTQKMKHSRPLAEGNTNKRKPHFHCLTGSNYAWGINTALLHQVAHMEENTILLALLTTFSEVWTRASWEKKRLWIVYSWHVWGEMSKMTLIPRSQSERTLEKTSWYRKQFSWSESGCEVLLPTNKWGSSCEKFIKYVPKMPF